MSAVWVDPTLHESARRRRSDRRKQHVFLPERVLAQMNAEARRQGRSLSQIVQFAVRMALPEIRKNPTVEHA